ncbi:hypothetical protein [Haloarcula sp. Atlit-47R]|uniref:hypothetical protein n=1 Tax=Haloarcula sp. Atlit-47R TaxID=2282132 RepID=UPI0018F58F61|nr:hypothetical protein [Haloarcula sp. Atlit-47R]
MTDGDTSGFVYEPARGPKRRVVFEPRSDGDYLRTTAVWNGCQWRETGREVVTDLQRV